MIGQYNDIECTLATCVLHNATKLGRNHHDATNRIKIQLKTRHHAFLASRFVIELVIEVTAVWDVTLRVAEAMVAESTLHATGNVIELFMQT